MNKLASIGLALAALLFVGCGDDLGKTCYDEDDCSGGNLICARDVVCTGTTECIGVCSDTCVTDDDCGSEEFCLDEIGTTFAVEQTGQHSLEVSLRDLPPQPTIMVLQPRYLSDAAD